MLSKYRNQYDGSDFKALSFPLVLMLQFCMHNSTNDLLLMKTWVHLKKLDEWRDKHNLKDAASLIKTHTTCCARQNGSLSRNCTPGSPVAIIKHRTVTVAAINIQNGWRHTPPFKEPQVWLGQQPADQFNQCFDTSENFPQGSPEEVMIYKHACNETQSCHTSLWGWHVDCDDLAVGGHRELGGHYFSTHRCSCNLESLPTRWCHGGLRACYDKK